ncbi:universal stress protein [Streptomyces sp. GD-15H]|uniref:universal stress protein n=1 Tax=Streptomyces sp. GD-15H TaxID=3129112 RepID=UPI003872AEE3
MTLVAEEKALFWRCMSCGRRCLRAASGAELLVVGHRLTDRPEVPRTGPVAHTVIRQAACPVTVVPHYRTTGGGGRQG